MPLKSNKMRKDAQYFRVFRRERENRGLLGGEEWIRTPGTARESSARIRPKLGGLFGPKKSIPAGENLFAWNWALFRLSPVPFVRQADARNWVMPNIQRRLLLQISPSLSGQSATRLCLFGIARGGVRADIGAGAVCGAVSNT